jgi:hypothetical protein
MEINYWIVIPFILIVLALVYWLVKRNIKDETKFEEEANKTESKPGKHTEEKL